MGKPATQMYRTKNKEHLKVQNYFHQNDISDFYKGVQIVRNEFITRLTMLKAENSNILDEGNQLTNLFKLLNSTNTGKS